MTFMFDTHDNSGTQTLVDAIAKHRQIQKVQTGGPIAHRPKPQVDAMVSFGQSGSGSTGDLNLGYIGMTQQCEAALRTQFKNEEKDEDWINQTIEKLRMHNYWLPPRAGVRVLWMPLPNTRYIYRMQLIGLGIHETARGKKINVTLRDETQDPRSENRELTFTTGLGSAWSQSFLSCAYGMSVDHNVSDQFTLFTKQKPSVNGTSYWASIFLTGVKGSTCRPQEFEEFNKLRADARDCGAPGSSYPPLLKRCTELIDAINTALAEDGVIN